MAAALLMSIWVACLARLDLNVQALGRLPLYSLGLILTFNMGRDITLIILYPFVFGTLAIWWLDHYYTSATLATSMPAPVSVQPGRPVKVLRQRSIFVRRANSGGFVKKRSSSGVTIHPPLR